MSNRKTLQTKLTEALTLSGYYLWELDEDRKEQYCLKSRKGKVFQIRDQSGKVLCTYSTLAQVKRFLSKKIGE